MVVGNTDCVKPGISWAKLLSDNDDIASSLTIDLILGFTTHKMAARFRPMKVDSSLVKRALEQLKFDGDKEAAYNEIVFNSGDWSQVYFLNKSRNQIAAFKEHVSCKNFNGKILKHSYIFFIQSQAVFYIFALNDSSSV